MSNQQESKQIEVTEDINPADLPDLPDEYAAAASSTKKPGKRKVGRPKGNSQATTEGHTTRKLLKAIDLRMQGLPITAVAKITNISPNTIDNILEKFSNVFSELPNIKEYNQHRIQLLTAAELKLLNLLMDPEKLAKASLNNVAYAFQQVHNANRLERGLSTANVEARNYSTITLKSYDPAATAAETPLDPVTSKVIDG